MGSGRQVHKELAGPSIEDTRAAILTYISMYDCDEFVYLVSHTLVYESGMVSVKLYTCPSYRSTLDGQAPASLLARGEKPLTDVIYTHSNGPHTFISLHHTGRLASRPSLS